MASMLLLASSTFIAAAIVGVGACALGVVAASAITRHDAKHPFELPESMRDADEEE